MALSISNQETTRLLADIVQRYGFESAAALLETPTEALQVRIGFIGEFSSGKSTLINAILGEALLPSRSAPTTANILQIEADASLDAPEYLSNGDGDTQRIDATTFAALACGESHGTLRMRIPPRGVLRPGIQLIDSPGVNAMVTGHAELTIAQLSLLDGLVVCLHSEMGTVPASMLKFLEREEIRNIAHKLIFVLTAADQKAPASVIRVKESMMAALGRVFPETSARPTLIATRALDALGGDPTGIDEFLRRFQAHFVERADELRHERRAAQLRECARLVRLSLQSYQQSMVYSDEEVQQRLTDAQSQLAQLQKTRVDEERRLEQWYAGFQVELRRVGERFAPVLARAQADQIESAFMQMQAALQDVALTHIRRYAPGADIQGKALPPEFKSALASSLAAHANYVQAGVTAVTMIAVTAATAGAGTGAVVAAEAGAAGAAAQSASATAVGTAARAATAAAAKAAVKKGAEAAAESVLKKVFTSSMTNLAGTIKAINPFEFAGDMVRIFWNDSAANEALPQLVARLAQAYHADMLDHLDTTCFRPLESALMAVENGIAEARAARSAGLESYTGKRDQLTRDLRSVDQLTQAS